MGFSPISVFFFIGRDYVRDNKYLLTSFDVKYCCVFHTLFVFLLALQARQTTIQLAKILSDTAQA